MTSTDIDGSPILIISVEEAKVAKTAIAAMQVLDRLHGLCKIKDPDKWEKVYEKLTKFLDEVDSGV